MKKMIISLLAISSCVCVSMASESPRRGKGKMRVMGDQKLGTMLADRKGDLNDYLRPSEDSINEAIDHAVNYLESLNFFAFYPETQKTIGKLRKLNAESTKIFNEIRSVFDQEYKRQYYRQEEDPVGIETFQR